MNSPPLSLRRKATNSGENSSVSRLYLKYAWTSARHWRYLASMVDRCGQKPSFSEVFSVRPFSGFLDRSCRNRGFHDEVFEAVFMLFLMCFHVCFCFEQRHQKSSVAVFYRETPRRKLGSFRAFSSVPALSDGRRDGRRVGRTDRTGSENPRRENRTENENAAESSSESDSLRLR